MPSTWGLPHSCCEEPDSGHWSVSRCTNRDLQRPRGDGWVAELTHRIGDNGAIAQPRGPSFGLSPLERGDWKRGRTEGQSPGSGEMTESLFIVSLALIAYAYFVYPLLLAVLARAMPRIPRRATTNLPPVSLIVAAYNEAAVIDTKIRNALAIDYPPSKLEIIIASDGSDDGTNEIVQGFADQGVVLNALPRGGKTRALNQTVPLASHDILVFSDANAMYQPNAVRELVAYFDDPDVGAVSGDVRLVNEKDDFSESEGLYYRYERYIQSCESAVASMVGVDGAMYAMRKSLYDPPSDDIITDDLVISMNVLRQGARLIYNPMAIAQEDSAPDIKQEFRRRTRYIAAGVHALLKGEGLPRLSQPLAWWMYLSHKPLRWLVPVFLIVMLASNALLLGTPLWNWLMAGQVAFYLVAAFGYFARDTQCPGILRVPFYFCLQNLGILVGLVKGVLKLQKAAWISPTRTNLK